jgi:hypothetical protein
MKFMMFVCVDRDVQITPEAGAEMGPATEAWVAEMDGRGVRVRGDQLVEPADATTVRLRDGEGVVTDGPFAETKEFIAGYDLLDCADLDEAIEIASKHPVARIGAIDVRAFMYQ